MCSRKLLHIDYVRQGFKWMVILSTRAVIQIIYIFRVGVNTCRSIMIEGINLPQLE